MKYSFLKKETDFLSHIIAAEGIKTNPLKIQAVDKIVLPKTEKEIKTFLKITELFESTL